MLVDAPLMNDLQQVQKSSWRRTKRAAATATESNTEHGDPEGRHGSMLSAGERASACGSPPTARDDPKQPLHSASTSANRSEAQRAMWPVGGGTAELSLSKHLWFSGDCSPESCSTLLALHDALTAHCMSAREPWV